MKHKERMAAQHSIRTMVGLLLGTMLELARVRTSWAYGKRQTKWTKKHVHWCLISFLSRQIRWASHLLFSFQLGLSLCKYTYINNDIFNFYPIFIKMIRFLFVGFITKTAPHSKLLWPSQDHLSLTPVIKWHINVIVVIVIYIYNEKKKLTK